jgi:hypothetical protein
VDGALVPGGVVTEVGGTATFVAAVVAGIVSPLDVGAPVGSSPPQAKIKAATVTTNAALLMSVYTRDGSSVVLAPRDDGEMNGVGLVAVAAQQRRQRSQLLQRQIDGAPANITHQMVMMTFVGDMDHAGPRAEVDVVHGSRLLQGVDGAVDGGEVDGTSQHFLGPGLDG